MSVIYKCAICDEETVVERVLSGAPLKCIHCGSEKLGEMNGTSVWMDAPLTDTAQEENQS